MIFYSVQVNICINLIGFRIRNIVSILNINHILIFANLWVVLCNISKYLNAIYQSK